MISIIIPVFNKIKYISKTLESLIGQSFTDYQCIIVDDGSTDGSGEVCDQMAEKDKRIIVTHIENKGVSFARNVGLDAATGEYITFIDADDTIAPNYLENLYNCITRNDVDLVISGVTKTNCSDGKDHIITAPYLGKRSFADVLSDFAKVQKSTGIYGTCVGKLFKSSLCKDLYFDEELTLAEDVDFYIRLYQRVDTVFFDDHALYYYLQDAENSSVRVKDCEIDYLKQGLLQIRIKSFLQSKSEYRGENKRIVDQQISNYFFLAMHYADKDAFPVIFEKLYEYYIEEDLELRGDNMRKSAVLYFLRHRQEKMAERSVSAWWKMRRLLKKGE